MSLMRRPRRGVGALVAAPRRGERSTGDRSGFSRVLDEAADRAVSMVADGREPRLPSSTSTGRSRDPCAPSHAGPLPAAPRRWLTTPRGRRWVNGVR